MRSGAEAGRHHAQLAAHADGRVLLRSRQSTDMTGPFPKTRAAALTQLTAGTGLGSEPVVRESDRLAFEQLQQRRPPEGCG
ncbi:hypothetical protein [Streptomyces sp. NPDC053069]|uniref:hypothetical protein n=1 Tax=Streptomyces sp. NPDC053069 TaxID=3365695 RepID=UPI0037D75B98